MDLRIKKLSDNAKVPNYAHETDAGMDLYSIENQVLSPGEVKLIHTGIAIELPANTEAQIRPRSGLAIKHGITVLNTPGTIDEGYRGEIGVILINHGGQTFYVEEGMRIAQMVIMPIIHAHVTIVNEISDSDRGIGGFGSTGQ